MDNRPSVLPPEGGDVPLTPAIVVPLECDRRVTSPEDDEVLLKNTGLFCGWTRQACEPSATSTWDILPNRTAILSTRFFPEMGYSVTSRALFHFQCLLYGANSLRASDPKRSVGPECLSEVIRDDQTMLVPEDPKPAPGCSLRRPWLLHDLPPSCRLLNSVVPIPSEQNEPVSSIPCHHVHLFSSHSDSDVKTPCG